MGVSCPLLARRVADDQTGVSGVALRCITYWVDDAVYPISILAHVWQRQGRQACVSPYRGKLAHPELEVES